MPLQTGPVSVEGYVSVITLNQPVTHPIADHQQQQLLLQNQNSVTNLDQTVLLSQPVHSFTQIPGPEEQTLLILPADQPNDMLLKDNQLLLLDVPGQGILQAGSVVQIQQSNQQLSLIHAPTLSLVQPSVELVQFPANAMFLTDQSSDQPVILCLQNATQPITLPQQHSFSSNGQTFVAVNDVVHQSSAVDTALNQVALAKSWHNDADLVNRALTALNRQPVAVTAANHISFDQLHLNCSPGHQIPCDKNEHSLTLT